MKVKYQLNQIHLFELRGKNFIFVTDSLFLYEADEETYLFLQTLNQTTQDKAVELEQDEHIIHLEEAGILSEYKEPGNHSADAFENEATSLDSDLNDEAKSAYPPMTNIVLELANDCNLNCVYCYGSGGSYGRKRELMSFETAKQSVDTLVSNSGDTEELLITFFGGEPLINFPILKKTVLYCHTLERETGKKFKFNMTSNGTIMNQEILGFLKEHKISTMLSMDGSKAIQDTYRPYESGAGSYDQILKNIESFKEANGGYLTVRATVCRPNTDMSEIKKSLNELGFTKTYLSLVDADSQSELFLGGNAAPELYDRYLVIADEYIKSIKETGKSDFEHFDTIISALYFKHLKIRSCNAGNSGFAVGSDAKIYPCHRFMGMDEYVSGNVFEGIDREKTSIYKQSNVIYKEDCKSCWAKFLCGGGCLHTCVIQESDVMKAPTCYCNIYRGIFEIVLYIYSSLKEWNEDVFRNIMDRAERSVTTVK